MIIMFEGKIISVVWSWSTPDSFSQIHPLFTLPLMVLKDPLIPIGIPHESARKSPLGQDLTSPIC